jgi:hypothetical protein
MLVVHMVQLIWGVEMVEAGDGVLLGLHVFLSGRT